MKRITLKGFFFADVLPGCESGEYLLLLHLMGLPMEWDKVVAIEGYQKLLDYVREHTEAQIHHYRLISERSKTTAGLWNTPKVCRLFIPISFYRIGENPLERGGFLVMCL